MPDFEGANAQVLGVSVDSAASNQAWAASLGGIRFPLLSDFWPHGEMCKHYGVLRDDGFAERAVVLVSPDGQVEYIHVYGLDELPDPQDTMKALRRLPQAK